MKSFGTTSSVTAFLTAGMVAVAFAGFSVHGCGGGGDSADAGVVPGTDGGGSGLEDTGGAGGEDTGGNGGEDAGSTDTGLADTGTPDAGELDVGTADAGGGEDGGTGTDAGDGDGGIPGVPEVLATGLKNPYAPVADATHLYWVDSEAGAVTRLAKSGGAPEVFVGSLIAPRGIALDADTVYFATSTFGDAAPKGTISKVGKGGGAPVELAGLQEVPEW
ncbi:MAG: hypothetical protein HY897_20465, partial [Deltaproteobacteria bacterium]|nr:hypothetical protein [Deltaproteobacteria bacterium]